MPKLTDEQVDKIIMAFCDKFEGKEQDIGIKLLVYGNLKLIADETGYPIDSIANVLKDTLDNCFEETKCLN